MSVSTKGPKLLTDTSPFLVIVKLFVLLSINLLLWQVNKRVFVIAVNGEVEGVKVDV